MKIVFMGTPMFAVHSLNALAKQHEVLAVFTQPDRPAGRGHKLQASPVKEAAMGYDFPVFQPETLRISADGAKEIRAKLQSFGADIFVVAAYGLLLPKGVLNMPRLGCINVHASLLPKYRGASPIHSTILNGDTETGITIMQMDAGMDTGDIIVQKAMPIGEEDRFAQVHDKMAELGGDALLEALTQLENGTAIKTPQDNTLASHAPIIKKSDGEITWNETSEEILNKIRAFDPWPGCYTMYNGQLLKIWKAEKLKSFAEGGKGLTFKTKNGAILVTELQAQGKKRMPAADFLRGQKN